MKNFEIVILGNDGWLILLLQKKNRFFSAHFAAAGFEPGPTVWQSDTITITLMPQLGNNC